MSEAHLTRRPVGALGALFGVLCWLGGCRESESTSAAAAGSTPPAAPAARICDEGSPPTAQGPASFIAGLCVDPNAVPIDVDPLSTPDFDPLCTRRFSAECPDYIGWGLRRFIQLRYVAASGDPENVEITLLRFTTPDAAHALFTQRGTSRVEPGQADLPGVAGLPDALILGDTLMVPWGADYVELRYYNRRVAGDSQASLARERLSAFAPSFVNQLPGRAESPRAFALLPREHLQRYGLRSHYRSAFGIAEVGPSTLGHYRDGERRYDIFAASYVDEAVARDVYRALRRLPGRHDLEEVPFDAFEVGGAWGKETPALWLVGINGARVAAVGSRRPPPKLAAGASVDWIERDQKMRLLRQLFSRR